MKIVICGSMKLSKKMLELGEELEESGHEVVLPEFTREYARLNSMDEMHNESVKNKLEKDLIRGYYHEIEKNDAVLVLNEELNGIPGYIGGNSFLEMGFAHVLDKKIYLLEDIPELGYKDEIVAMQPVILNGDISLI